MAANRGQLYSGDIIAGTVAIRGSRNGFVLVYVPLDENGDIVT